MNKPIKVHRITGAKPPKQPWIPMPCPYPVEGWNLTITHMIVHETHEPSGSGELKHYLLSDGSQAFDAEDHFRVMSHAMRQALEDLEGSNDGILWH